MVQRRSVTATRALPAARPPAPPTPPSCIDKQITVPNTQTRAAGFIYLHRLKAFVSPAIFIFFSPSLFFFLCEPKRWANWGEGSQTVMTEVIVKKLRGQH